MLIAPSEFGLGARKGARHALAPVVPIAALYAVAYLSGHVTSDTNQAATLARLDLDLVLSGVVLIGVKRFARCSAMQLRWDLIRFWPGILPAAFPPVERSDNDRIEDATPISEFMARDVFEDSHRAPAGGIRWAAGATALLLAPFFVGPAVWQLGRAPSVWAAAALALSGTFFAFALHDMAGLRRRELRRLWRGPPRDPRACDAVELGAYSPQRSRTVWPTVPGLLIFLVPCACTAAVWQSPSATWAGRFGAAGIALALWLGAWMAPARGDGPLMSLLERATAPLSDVIGRALLPTWRACRRARWLLLAAGLLTLSMSISAPASRQASFEPWAAVGLELIALGVMVAFVCGTWRRPTDVLVVSTSQLRREHVGDGLDIRMTRM